MALIKATKTHYHTIVLTIDSIKKNQENTEEYWSDLV